MVSARKRKIIREGKAEDKRRRESGRGFEDRRRKQREVEERIGIIRGGEPTPTREITPTAPEEPVRLGFEPTTKEEALESLERGTRFSEVKELGVTGPEFGARKRELFAEEHPIEKGLLDAASIITLGLLGAKTFTGLRTIKKAATIGRGAFQTTLSGEKAVLATRYATNIKSTSLTKSWLVRIGITAWIAKTIADLYGTYPFASFGKEETLQSISFPLTKAIDAGDLEGAQNLLDVSNEILQATPTLAEKIPYVNVQKEFLRYIEVQTETNIQWQRIIDIKTAELTGEVETKFARERRLTDEAAIERKKAEEERQDIRFEDIREKGEERTLEEEERQAERFADIDIKRRETKLAEEESETERFAEIDRVREEKKLREIQITQEVWRLRREGRFAEADALELTIFQ